MNKTALRGHTSPETAFVVDDYPYGFRLRTKIRYWVETKGKSGCGQRFCSQTLNPKTGAWNKPKCGVYYPFVGMFLDDLGHVQSEHLHSGGWDNEEKLREFEAFYSPLSEYEVRAIKYIRATNKVNDVLKWEVKTGNEGERQTVKEQEEIYNKALNWAYGELKKEEA